MTGAASAGVGTVGGSQPLARSDEPVVATVMESRDIPGVIALLRSTPGLGYCEWEDGRLLHQHLAVAGDLCRVARGPDGQVVGALVAGSFGVRGTISHVAVASDFRRRGVARQLVHDVMDAFRERGIRRVFLFVLDGNDAATGLWSESGFRRTLGESTLECDL